MTLSPGTLVDHLDFGPGKVLQSLGDIVLVDFFGDQIDCPESELVVREPKGPRVRGSKTPASSHRVAFRRAFEAVNLGVVPPDKSSLIELSIGGEAVQQEILKCLETSRQKGLCKVVFGNYGTGKSHYLHLVSVTARSCGWLVSYLEFDPKAVDPAKPHLVYREIMSRLCFPEREDGSQSAGFHDLIKEIRQKWDQIRDLPLLKKSPWFRYGLDVLRFSPHNDDPDYVSACGWLAGQNVPITGPGSIRALARETTNINPKLIPNMPKVRNTAEIYVFHLAVVNEIARALGYEGLLIILDEAEHVRGYNVRRKERANNFYELLARTTHPPLKNAEEAPVLNDHGFDLPQYWANGPHFGLYVGLTEGDTFQFVHNSLREACVFLHEESDRVILQPPSAEDYGNWCRSLLSTFHQHYPSHSALIASGDVRQKIAAVLQEKFETYKDHAVMRSWVKLACLVPSVLMANKGKTIEELIDIIEGAVKELTGGFLPWE
ncbi:MAG: ATP-binding protein [Deltaproteobacteria bacterium]|jgi:hypothetical protein|nr:ATP-binding protein [Deltaproteobacteria bacterium]MCK9502428.1 ATP-binding protein [Lascolabacillus sp.]